MKICKNVKILFFAFIFILYTVCVASCEKKNENEPSKADVITTKMTIGFYSTESYNPLLTKSDYNRQAYSLVFDSLYNINSDFSPKENLASDLYIENGGLSATLQIKPNVHFHDGSELNAYDVCESIRFIMESEDNYYKYNVRNISEVAVENDYTVRFTFSELAPNIKNQLTFPIVKKDDLKKNRFPLNGTGPYKLKNENSGKEIVLTLNKNYFSDFDSTIKDIYVEIIPDKITSRSLSGSGIVDAFFASFYDEGLKTVTKTQSTKTDYPTDEYTFISLNYDNGIMYLKSFRKALSLAVDREKIKSDIFMSHGEETSVPVYPRSWLDTSAYLVKKDTDEAKKLLFEIGYEDTDKDGILEYTKEQIQSDDDVLKGELSDKNESTQLPSELSFSLLSYNSPLKESICNELKKELKTVGIELRVSLIDDYEYFMELYNKKVYDMCLVTTNMGYDIDLSPFMTIDGEFASPVEMGYDSQLIKLAATGELDLKAQVYKGLCDKFYDNMPHIPLLFLKNTFITNNKFEANEDIFINSIYYNILNNKKLLN